MQSAAKRKPKKKQAGSTPLVFRDFDPAAFNFNKAAPGEVMFRLQMEELEGALSFGADGSGSGSGAASAGSAASSTGGGAGGGAGAGVDGSSGAIGAAASGSDSKHSDSKGGDGDGGDGGSGGGVGSLNVSTLSTETVPPHSVVVNISPMFYCHCLLLLHVREGLPQVLSPDMLLLGLRFARMSRRRDFRVGFNSLGAFASVNHLHLQGLYLKDWFTKTAFPIENARRMWLCDARATPDEDEVDAATAKVCVVRGCLFGDGSD